MTLECSIHPICGSSGRLDDDDMEIKSGFVVVILNVPIGADNRRMRRLSGQYRLAEPYETNDDLRSHVRVPPRHPPDGRPSPDIAREQALIRRSGAIVP
jgi:hypothetical protein